MIQIKANAHSLKPAMNISRKMACGHFYAFSFVRRDMKCTFTAKAAHIRPCKAGREAHLLPGHYDPFTVTSSLNVTGFPSARFLVVLIPALPFFL